jgi:hypothetical protein
MTRTSNILQGLVLASAAAAGLVGAACKGEPKTVPDPQTEKDLDICKTSLAEKNKLVASLQESNTQLQMKGSAGEITVNIETDASQCKLTVRPPRPGEVHPVDDKLAAAASAEFYSVVNKSRGAIQKCYEQALKKSTGLQSKAVTLTVSATFSKGTYQNGSSAPSLGDTFDNCMHEVAKKWTLKPDSPAMTFKAPVSLTPS